MQKDCFMILRFMDPCHCPPLGNVLRPPPGSMPTAILSAPIGP